MRALFTSLLLLVGCLTSMASQLDAPLSKLSPENKTAFLAKSETSAKPLMRYEVGQYYYEQGNTNKANQLFTALITSGALAPADFIELVKAESFNAASPAASRHAQATALVGIAGVLTRSVSDLTPTEKDNAQKYVSALGIGGSPFSWQKATAALAPTPVSVTPVPQVVPAKTPALVADTSKQTAVKLTPTATDMTHRYQPTSRNGLQQASGTIIIMIFAVTFALVAFIIVTFYKIFTKANVPGIYSVVPFYNSYIMAKMAGKPGWWMFLPMVPFVGFIFYIILLVGLAKSFGKGVGFGFGLAFIPMLFFPVLAFGSATYEGPQI